MIIRNILLCAALTATCAHAQRGPVMSSGGGIRQAPVAAQWAIGQDGVAHFANLDSATMISGVRADTLAAQASSAVPKTWVGAVSGVAGLDANGNVTAPVTGVVSAANARASYSGSVPRTISSRWSEVIDVADFGALLRANTATNDQAAISAAFAVNSSGEMVKIQGGYWPDVSWQPTNTANTRFVNIDGYLHNRPARNITDYGLNIGVPNFGYGVTSLNHGEDYDTADWMLSRVDKGQDRSSYSVASFNYVSDGNNATRQDAPFAFTSTSTTGSSGYTDNAVFTLNSMGKNGWAGQDTNKWSHTVSYGTNWLWDNIQELYDWVPFACPPSEENQCFARYMNEEDMYGIGPEKAESSYDPTNVIRKMFWLTTNHNVNYASDPNLRWQANTSYFRYQIITAKDGNGHEWMFQGLPINYNTNDSSTFYGITGASEPTWSFTKGNTVSDGSILWTNIGPWTYDLGAVLLIGGDNDPSAGYNERIGSVLAEQTDSIYNAIIDMSKAVFDSSVPVKVFARIQPDVYFDLSADGTQSGQNTHLLGYSSASRALEYFVGADHQKAFSVDDSGNMNVLGITTIGVGSQASLETMSSVSGSATHIGYDRFGGNESDIISNQYGLNFVAPDPTSGALPFRAQMVVNNGHVSLDVPLKLMNVTSLPSIVDAGYIVQNNTDSHPYIFENGWQPLALLDAGYNLSTTGNIATGGYFQETLTTPSSSSAACTAGQFTDDANYHYVCVATNTWKRVALSSF
ncbi:hypothetical protein [Acidomonas methanolica]|uniref:Uncharacterized protein n=1 Tax=Acidomonas methanolica NBRC 104435 TaxID=1231351 RepID=A0A023D7E8_ACIMT|nr:hypothetical protein [Acidomonas methanolica]MBU2653469.1 hypothetical protein [Acidomonas methanolica]TCS32422.1 hypothetical protein EDC31_101363 [Acidomonas methanolica]GAJ30024.1 hypothetical protein Amme_099_009 [Acidomonas methanolica NBRC 104435]GBQ54758.1 hypothetical protein AA0498_2166 [Acidomonas methanolica]GEK97857.1 hypothetical protein AME01nite_03560 [Acidomonas methanolica NBRC 104435]